MIDDLCDRRIDIGLSPTRLDAEAGHVYGDPEVVVSGLPCRMTPAMSSFGRAFGQRFADATHVFHVPGAFYLTSQHMLLLRVLNPENKNIFGPFGARDRTFQVLGSYCPDEQGEFTIIAAREYDPGEPE